MKIGEGSQHSILLVSVRLQYDISRINTEYPYSTNYLK
jgi:hypothetical protein